MNKNSISRFDEEPVRSSHDIESLSQNAALKSLVDRLAHPTNSVQQHSNAGGAALVPDRSTKDSRDLFVGNVPEGTVPETLRDFLNAALRQVGLNTTTFDPIINCRMAGKYAFIECYTIDDASNALNLNGIPFMNIFLKVTRPAKYQGPITPARPWQEIMGHVVPTGIDTTDSTGINPSTKQYRELFVGNTGSGMNEQVLKEFVGSALQQMGLANFEGINPVHSVRVSSQYCFVELRTVEEAANLLNLAEIPYNNTQLKISRPSKYINLGNGMPYYTFDEYLSRWATGEMKLLTAGDVTNVLCITNMISKQEMEDEQLFNDTIEDTMDECSKHGKVKSVFSPRTTDGRAFVEMENDQDAKNVLLAIKGRKFDGRIVDIKFYPPDLYQQKIYNEALPTIVIGGSRGVVSQADFLAT